MSISPVYDKDGITIYHGDCLSVMAELPEHSVDMVLCDLPYGSTACAWDSVIPLAPLWEQYKRLLRRGGGSSTYVKPTIHECIGNE